MIVVLVRIDFFLGLFEKYAQNTQSAPIEVDESDIRSGRETIPFSQDPNFKQTPKRTFLALLEDFQTNPVQANRERAMSILKSNPAMFNLKLDKELEFHIFRWRDHLINNNQETVNFMLELMDALKGENLDMMRKFFSLWMDINMEHFIAAYSRTKDTNCSIATTFGDNIPEEEKRNEIYDRQDALKAIVANEKTLAHHKALATNCLLVLAIEIAKFPPPPASEEGSNPETTPESQSGVSP